METVVRMEPKAKTPPVRSGSTRQTRLCSVAIVARTLLYTMTARPRKGGPRKRLVGSGSSGGGENQIRGAHINLRSAYLFCSRENDYFNAGTLDGCFRHFVA